MLLVMGWWFYAVGYITLFLCGWLYVVGYVCFIGFNVFPIWFRFGSDLVSNWFLCWLRFSSEHVSMWFRFGFGLVPVRSQSCLLFGLHMLC